MSYMSKFEHGLKEVIIEITCGIIISSILSSFKQTGLIDPFYITIFSLVNLVGTLAIIIIMPNWGITYLFGWLVGLLIMSQSGLVELWEFILYAVAMLFTLFLKIKKFIER